GGWWRRPCWRRTARSYDRETSPPNPLSGAERGSRPVASPLPCEGEGLGASLAGGAGRAAGAVQAAALGPPGPGDEAPPDRRLLADDRSAGGDGRQRPDQPPGPEPNRRQRLPGPGSQH